jgi:hypothetical protein
MLVYSILSDPTSLKVLSSSSAASQQQVDHATLPPLPSIDDVSELQRAVSHDDWGDAIATPEETYNSYQGTVEYFYPNRRDILTPVLRPRTSRTEILFYYHLRKHLTTNLGLLTTFSEAALSSPPSLYTRREAGLTSLEEAQNAFAIHHISISETLLAAESLGSLALGLPCYEEYRLSRNFFAHVFGTPKKGKEALAWAVEGKRGLYEPLLRHVSANIGVLERKLGEEGLWMPPEPLREQEIVLMQPQPLQDEDVLEEHVPTKQFSFLTRLGVFCCRSSRVAY